MIGDDRGDLFGSGWVWLFGWKVEGGRWKRIGVLSAGYGGSCCFSWLCWWSAGILLVLLVLVCLVAAWSCLAKCLVAVDRVLLMGGVPPVSYCLWYISLVPSLLWRPTCSRQQLHRPNGAKSDVWTVLCLTKRGIEGIDWLKLLY